MKKRIMMIEESLNEFSKRGRPKKNRNIDVPDAWENQNQDDDEEIIDDIDVDVSDMTNGEEIEIEEDSFDSELLKALNNELKIPEFSRRLVKFRLKGNLTKTLKGILMAKLGSNAFLFKLDNGEMKKVFLKDMILEQEKGNDRTFTINEVR